MKNLKVSQSCFHTWLILIKYFIDCQKSFRNFPKKEFYETYFECWVFDKSEEEIKNLTNNFLKEFNLFLILQTKNYYWEYSEEEQNWPDSKKWIWMYNTIRNIMLTKESNDIKNYFKFKYCPEEIDFRTNWNDELFD
jgi:hypothetical protein